MPRQARTVCDREPSGAAEAKQSHTAVTRGAAKGGLTASGVILALNQVAHAAGLTDYDLLQILGLSFGEPDRPTLKWGGLTWYFVTGGILVPTLYWLGFRLLGRAGGGPGACLGVAHYLGSGLLAASDPRRPRRSAGEGRPMGASCGYGVLERIANVAGHLAYGFIVGAASGR